MTENAGGIDPLKNNSHHGKKNVIVVGWTLRSGTIPMIWKKTQGGKSAYAIGKGDLLSKMNRFSKLDAYKPLLHKPMN